MSRARGAPAEPALGRELDFAIAAARSAGQRVLKLRESGRWQGDTLADVGDQAADGLLQGLIRGRYPDDGLLSEETADSPERLEKQRSWIVDPLDGTKEFSEGREDWAVHVALTVAGRCAVGAVALPALGKVLWGSLEGDRPRAGIEGGGELAPGDSRGAAKPRVVLSRSHTPAWMDRFCDELGAGERLPTGSVGFKVSRLLFDEADVYVHKRGLKEWDTCAPEVVARALGWSVSKLRGEEHAYNQRDPKNHELVICRPAWRERVLAAVKACGALEG
jgi:3'(2'), 5'-bisphosphate nucleotidase